MIRLYDCENIVGKYNKNKMKRMVFLFIVKVSSILNAQLNNDKYAKVANIFFMR